MQPCRSESEILLAVRQIVHFARARNLAVPARIVLEFNSHKEREAGYEQLVREWSYEATFKRNGEPLPDWEVKVWGVNVAFGLAPMR